MCMQWVIIENWVRVEFFLVLVFNCLVIIWICYPMLQMLVYFFIFCVLRDALAKDFFAMCLKTKCLTVLPRGWISRWHGHRAVESTYAIQVNIWRFFQWFYMSCDTFLTQWIHLLEKIIHIEFTSKFTSKRLNFNVGYILVFRVFIVRWLLCFLIHWMPICFDVIHDLIFSFILFINWWSFTTNLV